MDNQSNLSPVAQQVFHVLNPVYSELRKELQEILSNLVKLANSIINKRENGEEYETELDEFNISLDEIEDKAYEGVEDEDKITILDNFFSKLRDLINE